MTRRERSYLLPKLTDGDRKLLATMPHQATLADEIAYLRLRLLHLAESKETSESVLMRLLSLLTRMVEVQAKLGGHDADDLGELEELVRQRLVKAGYSQPAAVEPAGVEPAGAEPAGAEPAGVEPAGVEPAAVEPAS